MPRDVINQPLSTKAIKSEIKRINQRYLDADGQILEWQEDRSSMRVHDESAKAIQNTLKEGQFVGVVNGDAGHADLIVISKKEAIDFNFSVRNKGIFLNDLILADNKSCTTTALFLAKNLLRKNEHGKRLIEGLLRDEELRALSKEKSMTLIKSMNCGGGSPEYQECKKKFNEISQKMFDKLPADIAKYSQRGDFIRGSKTLEERKLTLGKYAGMSLKEYLDIFAVKDDLGSKKVHNAKLNYNRLRTNASYNEERDGTIGASLIPINSAEYWVDCDALRQKAQNVKARLANPQEPSQNPKTTIWQNSNSRQPSKAPAIR